MTRFSLISATLLAAACTDEVAAPTGSFVPAIPATNVRDVHVRTPPPAADPATCVAEDASAASFSSTGHDELHDVAISPTGTILVAGYEYGTDTTNGRVIGSRGSVFEYWNDLTGLTRRALLATGGTDSFESIVIAPDTQRIWVAARTNGDLPGLESRGGFDVVAGELAPTGGVRPFARGWQSTSEHAHRVAISPQGLLAISGSAERVQLDSTTTIDPFLAVYDTSDGIGSPLWHTTRYTAFDERYVGLDVSDNAVVAGGGISDGDEQGMFVIAYDQDAGVTWRRQLSQLGTDVVTAVKILPGGDIVWAGTSASQLGAAHAGGTDMVVGRLAGATGATVWAQQYGSERDERASDLEVDGDGRIYIAGGVDAEDADVTLLVLDAGGAPLVHEHWGSAGNDVATAVAVDPCGAIVIVGHSDGDLVGTPKGGRDGFVLVSRLAHSPEFH